MEEIYSSLVEKTFTGTYMGLQPDNVPGSGHRKVSQVNPEGNEEIHEAIRQIKSFISGNAEVIQNVIKV